MTLLLINAPIFFVPRLGRAPSSTHLHLLYSYLRTHDIDTQVFDPVVEMGTPATGHLGPFRDALREKLASFRFDVAGISCWLSCQYLGARFVASVLREIRPETLIIVGGIHVTAVPEDFLDPDGPFDFVVTGQAEATLVDITRLPRRPPHPTRVPGKPAPMDDIRFDWTYPYSLGSLYVSRGCPFRCNFCVERKEDHACYGTTRALEEYARATKASTDGFVHLQDASFGVGTAWRKAVLRGICELGSNIRPEMEMRIDLPDDEDIELLGSARARVLFGIESGSPEMLLRMGKARRPDQYLRRTREVLAACDRHGVQYMLSFLYNHPGETRSTLTESIDFFWRLLWDGPSDQLRAIHVHRFAWYPGTPLEPMIGALGERYGTIVHRPLWWRDPADDHLRESEWVTASEDLSPERATELAQRLLVAQFLCRARDVERPTHSESAEVLAMPTQKHGG